MVWTAPKTFTAGERLFAQDLNTYVSDNLSDLDPRTVKSFADASARSTAIPSPATGAVTFLEDTDALEVYDGSAWTAVGSTPAILQVVSTTKTDTFSASLASAATTAITGLTASLTCSSASNKVLIRAVVTGVQDTDNTRNLIAVNLMAGVSVVAQGDAASNRTRVTGTTSAEGFYTDMNNQLTVVVEYLYSPASTSAITYGVNVVNQATGTQTIYVNRSGDDVNDASHARAISTLTVMEVAA